MLQVLKCFFNNKHMFCNKRFKSFLESQTFKGKPTPLLAIKKTILF